MNPPKTDTIAHKPGKFTDPRVTAAGNPRAWVTLKTLNTLWVNTGTLCNIQCANCYIESSPTNDRLAFITCDELTAYLDEIAEHNLGTRLIAFTGGEPFVNPDMVPMLETCLARGFDTLVLTNAMTPMQRLGDRLLALRRTAGDRLAVRVSIDHHTQDLHEKERGPKTWAPMLKGLKWLSESGFNLSAAGRTCWGESLEDARRGYRRLFDAENIRIDARDPDELILFPELDESADVPEITTGCWNILGKSPDELMCAESRMIVKRRGANQPAVVSCTLIPYDQRFELGTTLSESEKNVPLNHTHCARFCVLGGGSCTGGHAHADA